MRLTTASSLRSRLPYRLSGYSLIIIGLLLMAASVGYLVFVQVAKTRLGEQNISVPLQQPTFPHSFERIDPERLNTASTISQPQGESRWRVPNTDEYLPVDWARLPKTIGALPQAIWIAIPAIGISAPIVELDTVWEDGKLVWERPVKTVGHHQGTPVPGETGNVVMSGHRSSPIRGEGAIFRKLGEIPGLLKGSKSAGEPVDVLLYTPETIYVYRTVSTKVVEPEQVDVFRQTAEPTLTLITCTPDLVYSHRLIVSALLVATAPL